VPAFAIKCQTLAALRPLPCPYWFQDVGCLQDTSPFPLLSRERFSLILRGFHSHVHCAFFREWPGGLPNLTNPPPFPFHCPFRVCNCVGAALEIYVGERQTLTLCKDFVKGLFFFGTRPNLWLVSSADAPSLWGPSPNPLKALEPPPTP